uniref:ABPBG23 n=1 Tax=Mus spretus TaxID=10096 RepID=A0A6M4RZ80_MUSSP|nr:ABPBG23 [Mus spretus]
MKGTLLLCLLVTGELSFQTSEVCVLFFKCYPSVLSGKRLYQELQAFNATAGEKVAFEKIQDCYKEGGLRNIFMEPEIFEAMVSSPERKSFYNSGSIRSILDLFSKLLEE